MKKLSFAGIICIIIAACNNGTNENIGSAWPDVKLDTLRQYDSLDLANLGYDVPPFSDSLIVEYPNGVRVIHRTVKIDSVLYYVVEGDLLMDEQEYMQYRINTLFLEDFKLVMPPSADLRIDLDTANNTAVRWPENDTITFCINRNSFLNKTNYDLVKANMAAAINDWMGTCNVVFEYKPQFDNSNYLYANHDVDFVVLEYNANGNFIAKAFFPRYPDKRKNLLLDPTYYNTQFNKVGVLRHELGHVLGFRHEHISPDAPPACPAEVISGTLALTTYDSISVMHYFCGGAGTRELKISPNDKLGASQLYGAPKPKPIASTAFVSRSFQ
ncbi:MAG: matrixin family metalloprotease [Bacteroidota bacterium]